jgi:hypothetical protein
MTSTSTSGKCGACCRWVTNGVICNNCDCCFHINCANSSPSLLENSMQWSCKYQKHAKHQEERIRHLERELRSARAEIKFLKTGYTSSKTKVQDISTEPSIWAIPKNSKSRSRRFSGDDTYHVQLTNRFSTLDVDQQSSDFMKHVKDTVKSIHGKTNNQKKKGFYCLVVVTVGKLDPCFRKS